MHSKEIIEEIKRLFNELFKNDIRDNSFKKPELKDEIDELFHIVYGFQESWIETKKFIECNRWNIVMLNNSLKEIYYVFLRNGEINSVGPIKKINIKSHSITLCNGKTHVLENLCPNHCVGLEVGKNALSEHFGIRSDKMKFVAEKLLNLTD